MQGKSQGDNGVQVELDIDGHQYHLQQPALRLMNWDGTAPDGLVAVLDADGRHTDIGYQAVVLTGTEVGALTMTMATLGSDPGVPSAADLVAWDEIVDISLDLGPDGGALVTDADDGARSLPRLPAGAVRVRIHARGRDTAAALEIVDDAVEEHWIVVWRCAVSARILHQSRDRTGAGYRALLGHR